MRITKNLLMTALFALTISFANASIIPSEKTVKEEIKSLIVKSDLVDEMDEAATIHINFMLNKHKEIIVISTDSEELDSKIKRILNYKKVKSDNLKVNKLYTLPLVVKK